MIERLDATGQTTIYYTACRDCDQLKLAPTPGKAREQRDKHANAYPTHQPIVGEATITVDETPEATP